MLKGLQFLFFDKAHNPISGHLTISLATISEITETPKMVSSRRTDTENYPRSMSTMDTDEDGPVAFTGTWNPAYDSNPESIASSDESEEDSEWGEKSFRTPVFAGFRKRQGYQGQYTGPPSRFRRSLNGFRHGQQAQMPETSPKGRDVYWSQSGPKVETRKVCGNTLELPVVAPYQAPPEDKKLILDQTRDRIAEASSGDWVAKTTSFAQRFVATAPNAMNEANIRLLKFKDFGSDVFSYGPPTGLQGALQQCELDDPLVLRYLSFEVYVHPRKAPPETSPVEDLPESACILAVLKLPLNQQQTAVHPVCDLTAVRDVSRLLRVLKDEGLDAVFGKVAHGRVFDTQAFHKELREIKGLCSFKAVYGVLLREYVGKGILKDINERLRTCRQVSVLHGHFRRKTVMEQHADFMRLVQEFDAEEPITCNLTAIAFGNLSYDIQKYLAAEKYEPPTSIKDNEEQYRHLAELKTRALEAESRLDETTKLIRRTIGKQAAASSATFLGRVPSGTEPEWESEEEMRALDTANYARNFREAREPDQQMSALKKEAVHFRAMLSVAEKAMRQASGERAPLECWGCKDIPQYSEDKFHRYRSCPNRGDPRVRENFKKNLQAWADKHKGTSRKDDLRGAGKLSAYRPRDDEQSNTERGATAMAIRKTNLGEGEENRGRQCDFMREFGIGRGGGKCGTGSPISLLTKMTSAGSSLKRSGAVRSTLNLMTTGHISEARKSKIRIWVAARILCNLKRGKVSDLKTEAQDHENRFNRDCRQTFGQLLGNWNSGERQNFGVTEVPGFDENLRVKGKHGNLFETPKSPETTPQNLDAGDEEFGKVTKVPKSIQESNVTPERAGPFEIQNKGLWRKSKRSDMAKQKKKGRTTKELPRELDQLSDRREAHNFFSIFDRLKLSPRTRRKTKRLVKVALIKPLNQRFDDPEITRPPSDPILGPSLAQRRQEETTLDDRDAEVGMEQYTEGGGSQYRDLSSISASSSDKENEAPQESVQEAVTLTSDEELTTPLSAEEIAEFEALNLEDLDLDRIDADTNEIYFELACAPSRRDEDEFSACSFLKAEDEKKFGAYELEDRPKVPRRVLVPKIYEPEKFEKSEEWMVRATRNLGVKNPTIVSCGMTPSSGSERALLVSGVCKDMSINFLEVHVKNGCLGVTFPKSEYADDMCNQLCLRGYIKHEERFIFWVWIDEYLFPYPPESMEVCTKHSYWEDRRSRMDGTLILGTDNGGADLLVIRPGVYKRATAKEEISRKLAEAQRRERSILQGKSRAVYTRAASDVMRDLRDVQAAFALVTIPNTSRKRPPPAVPNAEGGEENPKQGDSEREPDSRQAKTSKEDHDDFVMLQGDTEKELPKVVHKHVHQHVHFEERKEESKEGAQQNKPKAVRHFHRHYHTHETWDLAKEDPEERRTGAVIKFLSVQERVKLKRLFTEDLPEESTEDEGIAHVISRRRTGLKGKSRKGEISAKDLWRARCIRSWRDRRAEVATARRQLEEQVGVEAPMALASLTMYCMHKFQVFEEDYTEGKATPPIPVDVEAEKWDDLRLRWEITDADHEWADRIKRLNEPLKWNTVVKAMKIRKWGRARLRLENSERNLADTQLSTSVAEDILTEFQEHWKVDPEETSTKDSCYACKLERDESTLSDEESWNQVEPPPLVRRQGSVESDTTDSSQRSPVESAEDDTEVSEGWEYLEEPTDNDEKNVEGKRPLKTGDRGQRQKSEEDTDEDSPPTEVCYSFAESDDSTIGYDEECCVLSRLETKRVRSENGYEGRVAHTAVTEAAKQCHSSNLNKLEVFWGRPASLPAVAVWFFTESSKPLCLYFLVDTQSTRSFFCMDNVQKAANVNKEYGRLVMTVRKNRERVNTKVDAILPFCIKSAVSFRVALQGKKDECVWEPESECELTFGITGNFSPKNEYHGILGLDTIDKLLMAVIPVAANGGKPPKRVIKFEPYPGKTRYIVCPKLDRYEIVAPLGTECSQERFWDEGERVEEARKSYTETANESDKAGTREISEPPVLDLMTRNITTPKPTRLQPPPATIVKGTTAAQTIPRPQLNRNGKWEPNSAFTPVLKKRKQPNKMASQSFITKLRSRKKGNRCDPFMWISVHVGELRTPGWTVRRTTPFLLEERLMFEPGETKRLYAYDIATEECQKYRNAILKVVPSEWFKHDKGINIVEANVHPGPRGGLRVQMIIKNNGEDRRAAGEYVSKGEPILVARLSVLTPDIPGAEMSEIIAEIEEQDGNFKGKKLASLLRNCRKIRLGQVEPIDDETDSEDSKTWEDNNRKRPASRPASPSEGDKPQNEDLASSEMVKEIWDKWCTETEETLADLLHYGMPEPDPLVNQDDLEPIEATREMSPIQKMEDYLRSMSPAGKKPNDLEDGEVEEPDRKMSPEEKADQASKSGMVAKKPSARSMLTRVSSKNDSRTKASGEAEELGEEGTTGQRKQDKEGRGKAKAMFGWIRALQSSLRKKPYAVALTERLPHMVFPIGTGFGRGSWKHAPTVRGVFDTGSGITIGYLPYWESVANRHPELVETFDTMDKDTFEELRVGGIEKEGEGATCTHFIELRTPFYNEGRPVTLKVALTESLSCNLIFGLPFIVRAKMVANLAEKFVVSNLFQATFPLEYHPPEVREEVVEQDGSVIALSAAVSSE